VPAPRYLRAAERHLAAADPAIASLIAAHGPCRLSRETEVFPALVRIVIAQQIATGAAAAIAARVEAAFPRGVTPRAILRSADDDLKACGLSGPKRRTIQAIAAEFARRDFPADRLHRMSDDAIAELLLPIRGVGPWTVDMSLMFVLARPDVLPVGDYGLRLAARDLYGLPDLPDATTLTRIAEPWRPYRTVASWYLWRTRDPANR
jgi:3-methyladenine DNA glycosylase/8-oxoguanine DNA glycosylase